MPKIRYNIFQAEKQVHLESPFKRIWSFYERIPDFLLFVICFYKNCPNFSMNTEALTERNVYGTPSPLPPKAPAGRNVYRNAIDPEAQAPGECHMAFIPGQAHTGLIPLIMISRRNVHTYRKTSSSRQTSLSASVQPVLANISNRFSRSSKASPSCTLSRWSARIISTNSTTSRTAIASRL